MNHHAPHGVKDRTNSYKRRDGQEMSQGKYCRLLTDLILLSIPVLVKFSCFFFKFSFLVFWQSSKKKKYDRKASAIFGLKEVARVLSALHNSLLPLCITMKTQTVLHTHRYSYWLFAWCWRTQKIQRFSSNNYTWPIHEWINVLEPKWKTVMFIYWTSIYFIHYM